MTANFPAFFPGYFPQTAFGQFWNQIQQFGNPFYGNGFGQTPFGGFTGQTFGQYPGQFGTQVPNGYVSDSIGNYFGQANGQWNGQTTGQTTGQNVGPTNGQYGYGQFPWGYQTGGQFFGGQPTGQWNQFTGAFQPTFGQYNGNTNGQFGGQFSGPFAGQFSGQFANPFFGQSPFGWTGQTGFGGQWTNSFNTPFNASFVNPYTNPFVNGFGTQPFNSFGINTPFFGGFNGWNPVTGFAPTAGFVNPFAFFPGTYPGVIPTNYAGVQTGYPTAAGFAGIPNIPGATGIYPTVNGVPTNTADANKARNIGLSREVA